MTSLRSLALIALAALSLAANADADRVITHENRILDCKKARDKGAQYELVFEHGVITIDKDKVKAVEIEGDMSDYVPKDDDERSKLAQGYVKYRNRWMSKMAFEDELAKETAASKKRAENIAEHADWNSCWSKETKHFYVNSNTSPEILDYYCELLEAYYSLMDDRFGIKPGPQLARTKMTVNIFKNVYDFRRVAKPGSNSVLGYFNRATQELNFFHNYAEPAQTEWVGLHECTHLLTYLIDPQYVPQIWLNEAVADYFGSSDISRDKKSKLVIKPGAMQADRLLTVQNAMKEGADTKLDKLFDLSRDEFDGFQYAHAWAFIYYLNESSPKYQKAFNKFFKDLYTQAKGITYETVRVSADFGKSGTGKQASAEEIRRVVLGALNAKDLDLLEKQWKEWIGAIELKSPDQIFKRAYQTIAYRGLWVFEADRYEGKPDGPQKYNKEKSEANAEQCLKDLDAALAGGLADPRAHWARYKALNFLDRDEEAKAALARAIELDPLNGRYRWDMGQLLYMGLSLSFGDGDDGFDVDITGGAKMPKPSEEAAAQFGLAMELAPDNDSYKTKYAKMMGDA